MKKILLIVCACLLLVGCETGMNDKKPDEAVATFFEKYRSKDDDIINQLKDVIDKEDLKDDNKEKYQDLMEKQYDSFAYVIKDTDEKDDEAVVTVELTVLNYRSAILKAEEELKDNPKKFDDDEGNFSEEKYMDYKIKKMDEVDDTTTHTIKLNLTKENGMWKVNQLSSDDISKLHGLY